MKYNKHELEQAKKHNRRVYITDIAASKVSYIKYYGFTNEQNQIMQTLAKEVMLLSKNENKSIWRTIVLYDI